MSNFIAGDFIRKDTHAYITSVKKTKKKDKIIKIGLGVIYILLCVGSLVVI